MLGGAGVERAASSGDEHFRVNVQEVEYFSEGEDLASVANWFRIACFQYDDGWESSYLILASQDAIARSHYSEVQFLLEGHAQPFVKHRHSFFFVSEQQHLGNRGAFSNEGINVGVGDLDDIRVKVACCSLLELFDGEVFGDDGGGDGGGRIDFEGGENLDALILADFGVGVTIDGPNSEDAVVLMDPLVELFGEGLGFAI